uniref:Secreted protein n=1 Tax=Romanomermis culicivorax TaxID=13658 RepID=A0A915JU88_ROMCU
MYAQWNGYRRGWPMTFFHASPPSSLFIILLLLLFLASPCVTQYKLDRCNLYCFVSVVEALARLVIESSQDREKEKEEDQRKKI